MPHTQIEVVLEVGFAYPLPPAGKSRPNPQVHFMHAVQQVDTPTLLDDTSTDWFAPGLVVLQILQLFQLAPSCSVFLYH